MNTTLRTRIALFIVLSPSFILCSFFMITPILIVLSYSLMSRDDYGAVVYKLTLDNYRTLLDPIYAKVFLNSFLYGLSNTVICLAFAYPVAYFVAFKAKRWGSVVLALILIPFWVNFLIRISAWIVLLSREGLINDFLLTLGLTGNPITMLGTPEAVMAGLFYAFLPSAILPIYSALQPIERSLLEAADDLGATPAQTFMRVTLPLSMPGVMAAALFVFVPTMGVFAIPVLLGGGKGILIGNLVVQLFLEFRSIPLGSAVASVMLAISMAGIYFYMRALRSFERRMA
ncbi:ABC transporter permease [Agrobacterium pusense]|uniref:ABC transporter permease n=1 Tax=Agrobacterium pusense TaxID=648995 RepID=UPI001FCD9F67